VEKNGSTGPPSLLPEKSFIAHFDGFYAFWLNTVMPRVTYISRIRSDAWIYEQAPPYCQNRFVY
jgi:hypothetical protein